MSLQNITEPVDPKLFVSKFEAKCIKWGNVVTQALKDTWERNALVFNNVIANKDAAIKYIVSAPTGTAKTENTITYCAMLPTNIKVLISTNLTAEADRLASDINNEAGDERAISYHSKKKIDVLDAAKYQIVIVSHEFYRRHHQGNEIWNKIALGRDFIVIDEALDTLEEYTVSKSEVEIAFNFFSHLYSQQSYNGNMHFEKCLKNLVEDLNFLTNSKYGKTTIVNQDKKIYMKNVEGETVVINSLHLHRYFTFLKILETNKFAFSQALTGINDASKDEQLKDNIINTLETLNNLQNRQAYITANKGQYSLHRVLESSPKQSFVCFDATADVNAIYDLRLQFKSDLFKVSSISNVRDYSNVRLHTAATHTGTQKITDGFVAAAFSSISLGNKTLVITHKSNKPLVEAEIEQNYSSHVIEVANWGAVTGLNTWQDFDTCVVIGLNHKPVSFIQNRVLINTNENEAFGSNQSIYFNNVEVTNLVSEIIQAINRIRVRKVIDANGNCQTAQIYLTLPAVDNELYIHHIKQQMDGINVQQWQLPTTYTMNQISHRDNVISHLLKTTKVGDKVLITEPRDTLKINSDTYKNVVGKTPSEQDKFKAKLAACGFEIIEEMVTGTKKPVKKKFIRRLQ